MPATNSSPVSATKSHLRASVSGSLGVAPTFCETAGLPLVLILTPFLLGSGLCPSAFVVARKETLVGLAFGLSLLSARIEILLHLGLFLVVMSGLILAFLGLKRLTQVLAIACR